MSEPELILEELRKQRADAFRPWIVTDRAESDRAWQETERKWDEAERVMRARTKLLVDDLGYTQTF